MMNIRHYMHDGADWQAQAVLAYMRGHIFQVEDEVKKKDNWGMSYVGRYENCREQGYVFSIKVGLEQRHYAVYEHRNSDRICVLISDGVCMDTPNVEFMWKDRGENATKYDYNKDFRCGEIMECGEWIIDDMLKWVGEINKERTSLE
jgi:hypothetical protein